MKFMMANRNVPSDEQPANPFYCPDYPGTLFVKALQRRFHSGSYNQTSIDHRSRFERKLLRSYARKIDGISVNMEASLKDDFLTTPNLGSSPLASDIRIHSGSWEDDSTLAPTQSLGKQKLASSPSVTFSDIKRSTKYANSCQSVHDSSFEVEIKPEKMNYHILEDGYSPVRYLEYVLQRQTTCHDGSNAELFTYDHRNTIRNLEDKRDGSEETPQSIRSTVMRLDALLPGRRLQEKLLAIRRPTFQKIAASLAQHGLLNDRVLNVFRGSDVKKLSLTASLRSENGLNMSGNDILRVFSLPKSFIFLSELSFNGSALDDFDIVYIHHLPNLAVLHLNNTDIGNEAIFHLISLKRSLTRLYICDNIRIDNAAVSALVLLSELVSLSFIGTSIDMDGLRLFFATVVAENRFVSTEIPSICTQYINNLESQYLVDVLFPLIVDPALCSHLPVATLKLNLSKHAECNPNIAVSGTRWELAERLEKILRTREDDLLVREMVGLGQDLAHCES